MRIAGVSARGLFVTGTDTGVGKTAVSVSLLRALAASGWRAVGMKPVAAGFGRGSPVNADVAALAAAGNVTAPQADRNPYAFAPAIAPHLAAKQADVEVELATIVAAYRRLESVAEAIVVEGAGGALVPLDARHDMLDIAVALDLPVLLVVGVRLGCLNHAALSALAIRARGLRLVGWIATRIDAVMPAADQNVAWLAQTLGVPLVADLRMPESPLPTAALAPLGFRAPGRDP
jgi:dethiobiotin synthetase